MCEHCVDLTRRGPTKIEPWEGMGPLKIQAVQFVGGLASLQFIGDGSVIGKSQVVYLDSFLRVGWFGEASGGRPMGGKGGGIPRLLDMMITSAMAMFETAWITVCGGGLFFLCSSVIWATSDRSPVT